MAAEGMSLWLYCNQRATDTGRMTREYASGYLKGNGESFHKTTIVIAHKSIPRVARLSAYFTLWSLDSLNLYHLLGPIDKRPSAHKYRGIYITTDANNAIHNQIYSPARRSPLNRGLIQHQYYADSVRCEERYERIMVEIS
jgi:hypothetical protein